MARSINHGRIVDQFFGELVAGQIEGVRPCAALTNEVHRLYMCWAEKSQLPATASAPWMCRYIGSRHGVVVARKRYSAGAFILGPHSVMYLAGPIRVRYGMELEITGRQIADFKLMVDAFEARVAVPEHATPLREPV